ncbi:MAG TPA: rod-binding protein [Tepidisphaeraceae bacterium]|jgi:Rod binding domain-containing protein
MVRTIHPSSASQTAINDRKLTAIGSFNSDDKPNSAAAALAGLKPLDSGDFLSKLRSAEQANTMAPPPPTALKPLSASDLAGAPNLPHAALHPLTAVDLDASHPPLANLKPLTAHDREPGVKATETDEHRRITQQAEKWVSQTFFGTLLKQMHEGPFKSDLFEGGRGGQAFSSMYNDRLAEHMARGAGSKLVKGIVRQIEGRNAYRKQAKSSSSPAAGTSQQNNPFDKVKIHVAPTLRG